MIRRMIIDDIAAARAVGDCAKVLKLKAVLRHFVERHRPQPTDVPACCC